MSQHYIMNMNKLEMPSANDKEEVKLPIVKEKVMSYEEKTVGSTPFFKCEACPYMALAEDDIKFHLFTVHPDLAKNNGLADNIQISCPGCTSIFDAEETLRNHLRNHHKMGIRDVKKMVKSLVQIALKNAKLKKEDKQPEAPPPTPVRQEMPDVKIPQLIEIVPDGVNANSESMPKGVAFISVDELNKMSTPNFEKVDPKEIIQEASINIVYTNELSAQYVNVSSAAAASTSCSVLQVSSVAPDLISSIQPHIAAVIDSTHLSPPQTSENSIDSIHKSGPLTSIACTFKDREAEELKIESKYGKMCLFNNCNIRIKDKEKLAYHQKCHQNGKLQCAECMQVCLTVEALHTHLWKDHGVDLELPTCEICGFKTYKKYRLYSIHMKCHGNLKSYSCSTCSKTFKNSNQLTKHNLVHKKKELQPPAVCSICQRQFSTSRRLKAHVATVHEKLRPFKCPECSYTAARKEELKLHIRSHTGDKPYACDECPYRSGDPNAMRRHKKTHCKEGVYKCKYCPYTTIQSTTFVSHIMSKHPNINNEDIHHCPYCRFKSISKDKFILHLTSHTDKEGIKLLIEMTNSVKTKPSWTIPSDNTEKHSKQENDKQQNQESHNKDDTSIDVEAYDCDSISESLPQDYSKPYATPTSSAQQTEFNNQVMMEDLSKDDNNSDCLISESSNDTVMERHQFASQLPLQMNYDNSQSNLREFLTTSASMDQSLLQNNNVNSLVTSHSPMGNNINNNIMSNFPIRLPPLVMSHSPMGNNINNNIMSNFPIRLPLAPQISVRNHITLKPVDKISLPLTTKVTGPIITPTQILPVPLSSNSPVNIINEPEGAPRKKPKISVKSNLILKGPDQVNMFHSQQKMAFKRLEDNERFGLGGPVTFNNLITTQFMQLQPETLSKSPSSITLPYPQETLMEDTAPTPVDTEINSSPQIFTFNQQMNVNQMTLLPPPEKIQSNDPSYIKLEATIKQNTQSPSLERMCNANLLTNPVISREYKASPPLEDLHRNMNEIKNEVKSDTYYNLTLNNTATNPSIIDQYLIDNIIGEQYNGHLDASTVVLPEIAEDQQNDVIEIDDNSDDNKLLPRFDINFPPLESMYLMHNDFHFLESDVATNNMSNEVSEMNRMVAEVPILNQKDMELPELSSNDFPNFIQGKKDPMMNTSVRPTTNKINVKNIELMKN